MFYEMQYMVNVFVVFVCDIAIELKKNTNFRTDVCVICLWEGLTAEFCPSIPLIVHKTHFYYQKRIWHLVQN